MVNKTLTFFDKDTNKGFKSNFYRVITDKTWKKHKQLVTIAPSGRRTWRIVDKKFKITK